MPNLFYFSTSDDGKVIPLKLKMWRGYYKDPLFYAVIFVFVLTVVVMVYGF